MKRKKILIETVCIMLILAGAVIGKANSDTKTENEQQQITKLAEGVYVIQHPDVYLGGPNGNTTVIIGSREVLVVDSGWPTAAQSDITLIRQWTNLPVNYLLNTHWHSDHNLGNKTYRDAFPSIAIIAHVETKKDMDNVFPNYADMILGSMRRTLKEGIRNGSPLTPEIRSILEGRLPIMEELLNGYVYEPPTLIFDNELDIDLGGREVKIKHPGRGNTSGDAVVYLPAEKILVAGDLLVHPFPYPYDGYPSEWVKTLDTLGELDIQSIVPGHGPVFRDKTYLYLVRDFFKSAVDQMNNRIRTVGPALFRTFETMKEGIDLSSFKSRFAGNDQELLDSFDSLAEQVIKLVYQEAALR